MDRVPVTDMERAIKFYETVFDFKLFRNQIGTLDMAWFPYVENSIGSSGSLVKHPDFYTPSSEGTLVYFTAFSGDLDHELKRVEAAGGKIIQGKKLIADGYVYMALLLDSDGNRIALHSKN